MSWKKSFKIWLGYLAMMIAFMHTVYIDDKPAKIYAGAIFVGLLYSRLTMPRGWSEDE